MKSKNLLVFIWIICIIYFIFSFRKINISFQYKVVFYINKRKPSVKLGVLHLTPIRLNFQPRFKEYISPPLANYFWLPVNGSTTSSVSYSLIISSLDWFSMYSFCVFSCCVNMISSTPKLSVSIFILLLHISPSFIYH